MAKKPLSERELDVRVVERYVERGTLSSQELDKYLADLPDLTDSYEVIDLEDPEPTAEGSHNGEGGNGEITEEVPPPPPVPEPAP